MLQWLKALFEAPKPAGPPQTLRTFTTSDPTISRDAIVARQDAWHVDSHQEQTIRLFEVANPNVEQCMLTYRAQLKTENMQGRAYLEMWCRLPGRGEFFSKGLHQAAKGTNDWSSHEIPFYLKRGQKPDLLKLNLVVEGKGKVWIREVELLSTPLK